MLRVQSLDMGNDAGIERFILTSSSTDLVNKGSLTEMFVGLEFIKNGNTMMQESLFYWQNLIRGASFEVDFVAAFHMLILPIEVKSGISVEI